MSTTLSEIAAFLDQAGLKFKLDEDRNVAYLGFNTKTYTDGEGEHHMVVVIGVQERGEYIVFAAPQVYSCPPGHRHAAAVMELMARLHWASKLVAFEYDYRDGEIRASVRLVLEESPLTDRQFRRCLFGLPSCLDDFHEAFRRALDSGDVIDPMEWTANLAAAGNPSTPKRGAARRRTGRASAEASVGLTE
ncbi:MAG: hypothetical protein GX595_08510 [Lentisphaerae bacterium]|nr:hypothetical protein [Lentisphaerota bacterium]